VVDRPVLNPSAALRRAARALALTTVGVLALAACGTNSGPSVSAPGGRSDQAVTSTTSSTTTPASTSTTTSTTVTTTAPAPAPTNGQRVTYNGLQFTVPTAWPVYSLASDPNRCVRLDQNAVYLGQGGPTPQCPSRVVGRTETVQLQPLTAASTAVSALATQPQTVNGLTARVDPNAATSGAFTVVFPDQGVVATITFRNTTVLAAQILQSFQHAS
jgi:hypothetical protein